MKLDTRLKRLEIQAQFEREKELTGVLFYDAETGELSGAYNWKPGQPHTRKMVMVNGCLRPEGFTGTMIIDDIPRTRRDE